MLNDPWHLVSNTATIVNRTAVEKVLDGYFISVRIELTDDQLEIGDCEWPQALKYSNHESLESLLDDDSWEDNDEALDLLLEQHGDREFIEMLQELASFLKTPLTVQAIYLERTDFPITACEWHVKPNDKNVEVKMFRTLDGKETPQTILVENNT